jgi:hypothetical protein
MAVGCQSLAAHLCCPRPRIQSPRSLRECRCRSLSFSAVRFLPLSRAAKRKKQTTQLSRLFLRLGFLAEAG